MKMAFEVELTTELKDNGQPHTMWKVVTASLHLKSTARPMFEGMLGRRLTPEDLKEFDIHELLGTGFMADVQHVAKDDGTVRAKIEGVTRAPKGTVIPPAVTKGRLYYAPDAEGHSDEALEALPKFLRHGSGQP